MGGRGKRSFLVLLLFLHFKRQMTERHACRPVEEREGCMLEIIARAKTLGSRRGRVQSEREGLPWEQRVQGIGRCGGEG